MGGELCQQLEQLLGTFGTGIEAILGGSEDPSRQSVCPALPTKNGLENHGSTVSKPQCVMGLETE